MTYTPDFSPEQIDFEQFCWLYSLRGCAHTVGQFEAIDVFASELPELCLDKISANEQALEFKDLLLKLRKWKEQPKEQLDIQKAKSKNLMYVIENLTGQPVKFHKIKSIFNPSERTASLHIYENTNTWWDFSCNKGGDVIDFVKIYLNKSFVDSVKWLITI